MAGIAHRGSRSSTMFLLSRIRECVSAAPQIPSENVHLDSTGSGAAATDKLPLELCGPASRLSLLVPQASVRRHEWR